MMWEARVGYVAVDLWSKNKDTTRLWGLTNIVTYSGLGQSLSQHPIQDDNYESVLKEFQSLGLSWQSSG